MQSPHLLFEVLECDSVNILMASITDMEVGPVQVCWVQAFGFTTKGFGVAQVRGGKAQMEVQGLILQGMGIKA